MGVGSMNKCILAVDDEPDVLMILRTALQTEGYDVCTASNGPDCLEVAAEKKPDLIILDLMMPGMDGFAALQKLKSNPETSTIPVIMLTGVSEKTKVQQALTSGIAYYLTKPFDFDDLMTKVDQAMSGFDD